MENTKPGIFMDTASLSSWNQLAVSKGKLSHAGCLVSNGYDQQEHYSAGQTSTSSDKQNKANPGRLPKLSEFGILDLKKPTDEEIRLGKLSYDALSRINSFSMTRGNNPVGVLTQKSFPTSPFYSAYQAPAMSNFPVQSSVAPAVSYRPPQGTASDSSENLNVLANIAVSGAEAFAVLPPGPPYHQRSSSLSAPEPGVNVGGTFIFACKFPGCSKSFPSRSRLTRHEIVHQGQKNVNCIYPGCPKKFSRKDNMLQHYRNHIVAQQTANGRAADAYRSSFHHQPPSSTPPPQ